jgi:predicted amidohydrolase YtcJ
MPRGSPRTAQLAALLAVSAALAGCRGRQAGPEFVLHGGKIFTGDSAVPWAEALLVRGERIAAVGASEAVLAQAARDAPRIDLGGRAVIPGLNDAHVHISPPPTGELFATAGGPLPDPSIGEVLDSLRFVTARSPAGTWISTEVGSRIVLDPRARRDTIDRVSPEHPVALRAWTGHGLVLNSAALRAVGIREDAPDPLGGRHERDASGRLTGLLEEYAGYNAWPRLAPGEDSAAVATAFADFLAAAARWGITSLQSFTSGVSPAALTRALLGLRPGLRLRLIRFVPTGPTGRDLSAWASLSAPPGSSIVVSGTKYVLDGTPVERLAAMRAPYADQPSTHGRLNFPADTLRRALAEALESGDQPLLHAVGDSAAALILSTMADLAPDSAWRRRRVRIEHGDGLTPDLYPLARRLGVVVVQNPTHFGIPEIVRPRFGADRLRSYQPVKSLLRAGIPVAFGSDGPLNPFLNLMLAIMHPDNPGEAVTLQEAVRIYTAGSAFADFAETERGRLAPGMLADLAVLSDDIFAMVPTSLPAVSSVLTIVGGKPVWDPDGRLKELAP